MSGVEALRESVRYCRSVTRRSATSFYYAFKTLPRRKARAFEIIYAFMRLSDDLSDDGAVSDRAGALARWRELLLRASRGETEAHPVMPALMQVMEEFRIPLTHLEELIDGTVQDLTVTRFATFEELHDYCYKVASVVGLVSLRVFGLERPDPETWRRAEALAVDCGQAFQLTNILRDVPEDLERGRVYLPQDELARFDLTDEDLKQRVLDARWHAFMAFQAERARNLYERSAPLVDMIPRDSRPCLLAMRGIYRSILDRICASDFDVWNTRASVPLAAKLGIAARALLGRFA